jgi:hypothetical protein
LGASESVVVPESGQTSAVCTSKVKAVVGVPMPDAEISGKASPPNALSEVSTSTRSRGSHLSFALGARSAAGRTEPSPPASTAILEHLNLNTGVSQSVPVIDCSNLYIYIPHDERAQCT